GVPSVAVRDVLADLTLPHAAPCHAMVTCAYCDSGGSGFVEHGSPGWSCRAMRKYTGWAHYLPNSYTILKEAYPRCDALNDLLAGLTVGIVAFPLAMAFAIASGVTPERGLFTAIVAGFLISALGGSRYAIGGPTGAFVVILYGIVARHGYDGLVVAT